MLMIFCVLDNPDVLEEVIVAWEKIDVTGVTIIESTGLGRLRREQIPLRYFFGSQRMEEGHLSLFVIVPDEGKARACLQAVEQVAGDLDQPNSGVFAAWPLSIVKGIPASPEE